MCDHSGLTVMAVWEESRMQKSERVLELRYTVDSG
jgi:hypothetical protein